MCGRKTATSVPPPPGAVAFRRVCPLLRMGKVKHIRHTTREPIPMPTYLTNRSYPSANITALGFPLSVEKPTPIDNGPVLFSAVKPITPWNRYFVDSEQAKVEGSRVCRWLDGTKVKAVVSQAGTSLTNEADRRWLPGTPTEWATQSPSALIWQGEYSGDLFDSLRLSAIAEAKTAGWDLGTLYAERRKTLSLIRSLVPTLLGQSKRIVKSFASHKEAKKFLKDRGENGAGAAWLHARYGVRPLVFDLISAYERLTRNHERLFRIVESTTKSSYTSSVFDPGLVTATTTLPSGYSRAGGQPSDSIYGVGNQTIVRNYSARCGIGVKSLVQGKFTVNPSLTAWEMVPYSFVIDWVLNIGDNILAWAPVFDRSLEYGWLSVREDIVLQSTASFFGTNVNAGLAKPASSSVYYRGRVNSNVMCTTDISAHAFRRVPVDVDDVPYGLALQFNLDFAKVADLAALASQNRRSWTRLLSKINL